MRIFRSLSKTIHFIKKQPICALVVAGLYLAACGDDSSGLAPRSDDDSSVESSSSVIPDSSGNLRSSSSTDKKSSSSKIATSSWSSEGTIGSSSSIKSSNSSVSKVESSSSKNNVPQSYAEAKVVPSGTYDCTKYKCFSTEYLNQEFLVAGKYGEILDERDSQVYKTVQIGDQMWMAQNLAYEIEDFSYCYGYGDESAANCATYGRLYRWAIAVGKSESECGYEHTCTLPTENIQGVCPKGWHLPSKAEWETLFTAVGGKSTADKVLKSTSGWYNGGNGTDAFGFSALPAGYWGGWGIYYSKGEFAMFWSSTEHGSDYAYYMRLYYDDDNWRLTNYVKYQGYSVRCVMDEDVTPASSSSEIDTNSSSSRNDNSSSSVKLSSSSSEAISSSSNAITPVYGDTLLDSRDGRSYKTVVIGNQIWMAEDLKYAPDSGNAAVGKHSWCYEDNDEYCEKYGRLYDWTATVDTLDSHCGYNHNCEPFDEPRQGICPEGWHIPSQKEAVELRTILSSADEDDDFGFDVQLSGYRNIKGQTGSFGFGKTIIYWTIDQYTDQYASNFIFSSSMAVAYSWDFKFDARSVRCLKD